MQNRISPRFSKLSLHQKELVMHSYLSIDLDYWRNEKNDQESTKVFKKVFSLGLPLYVVKTHEQLLSHINRSRYDVIYNVDYHSDIFGFHSKEERAKWVKDNPKPESAVCTACSDTARLFRRERCSKTFLF